MDWLIDTLTGLAPLAATLVFIAAALAATSRVLPDTAKMRIARQLVPIGIVIVGMILVILALPIDNDLRGQLLSLFGLVLTGVVGLSSTTFVSNAMSGLMLRTVPSYHTGDFIRVEDNFGRVTEKGLLHTEIQTEDRDLITLPNLYLITHPVRVVRRSGTLVSAEASLGYDVHRHDVRDALLRAAEAAELTDAFVQILELGDFSISYRVSGFLSDVDNMVGKRTQLRGKMLDELHAAGIEIVSPSFMNQRPLGDDKIFLPEERHIAVAEDLSQPESIMFDKADLAARLEKIRHQRDTVSEELKSLSADPEANRNEIAWREQQLRALTEILETLEARNEP